MKRILSIIVLLSLGFAGFRIYRSHHTLLQPGSAVSIAVPRFYSSALFMLAQDLGYFEKFGALVKLDYLDYGRDCIQKMIKGEYDFSVAYVTPIVNEIQNQHNFSILTEVHNSSSNTTMIYRIDKIKNPKKDFYKEKVGLVPGTNAEFFLHLFFLSNFIDVHKTKTVFNDMPKLIEQFERGEISAAVLWQPDADQVLAKNTELYKMFEAPYYTDFSFLIARENVVTEKHEQADAIIQALISAENYFNEHPEESKKIVIKHLPKYSSADIKKVSEDVSIKLGLSMVSSTMLNSEMDWKEKSVKLSVRDSKKLQTYFRDEFIKKHLPGRVTYQ